MRFRALALFVAAFVLSACGGGAMLPGGPAGTPHDAAQSRDARVTKLVVRLRIPRPDRHAHYVSPSTKSLTVFQGKSKLGTLNATTNSKYCSSSGGATLCTFTLGVAPGKNQTISISAYDAAGGKGNLLSTGKVTQTIVAGRSTVIPITLGG